MGRLGERGFSSPGAVSMGGEGFDIPDAVGWTPADLAGIGDWWAFSDAVALGGGNAEVTSRAGAGSLLNGAAGGLTVGGGGITFDGVTGYMIAGVTITQPATIYVRLLADPAGAGTIRHLIAGDPSPDARIRLDGDSRVRLAGAGGSFVSSATTDGTEFLVGAVLNDASSALYLDGGLDAIGGIGTTGVPSLLVGISPSFTDLFVGTIYDIIVCSGAHGAAEQLQVAEYFGLA